jgi:hypothetical protein
MSLYFPGVPPYVPVVEAIIDIVPEYPAVTRSFDDIFVALALLKFTAITKSPF